MQKLNLADLKKVAPVLDANNISLYDFKVSIYYDIDLADLYFNDFKEGCANDNINLFFGSRLIDYLVIFKDEKVANTSYYKKSKLARMNKTDLTNLADGMLGYGFDDSTKQTLIDGLMSITNKDYYTNRYENESYQNLDYDFAISGYSQGDYCKVKIVGNVEKWIDKEYLTNIFYDTPLVGNVEVICNGKSLYSFSLYDLANFDEYASYNKSDIINMVAGFCKNDDYCNLLVGHLNDNLPDVFEYRY